MVEKTSGLGPDERTGEFRVRAQRPAGERPLRTGSALLLIRLASFIFAAECLLALCLVPRSLTSTILAGLFAVFFLIHCWSLGAFAGTSATDSRKAKP